MITCFIDFIFCELAGELGPCSLLADLGTIVSGGHPLTKFQGDVLDQGVDESTSFGNLGVRLSAICSCGSEDMPLTPESKDSMTTIPTCRTCLNLGGIQNFPKARVMVRRSTLLDISKPEDGGALLSVKMANIARFVNPF